MKFSSFGATDVGLKREHNEDSFVINDDLQLYIVCDGMGGHAAGEVASKMAIEQITAYCEKHKAVFQNYKKTPSLENRQKVLAAVDEAIQVACKTIYKLAQDDPTKKGMGTTVVMMVVMGTNAVMAHVGDSRIYLLRGGEIHQLTEDHSLVAEQLRKGFITPEEAARSPYANVITRAVGFQEFVQVDTLNFELQHGDKYLLCSDGLSGYFRGDEFKALAERFADEDLPAQFINLANARGGKDNITVILLSFEEEAVPETALTAQKKLMALKHIPLFRYLTYKELIKLLNIVTLTSYKREETIIEEDTLGDEMYVLLTGAVRVVKQGHLITELKRGSFFGEMGLIDKAPRSASIIANDDSKLMVIRRQKFYPLLRQEPQMAVKLLWSFVQVLNQRLRETNEQLKGAKSQLQDLEDEHAFLFTEGE
ncbi:MAG: hypothetical protein Kow0090_00280 [Myxococcota bacterium]